MTDFKPKNRKKNVYETKSFKRKYYENCIKDYYVVVKEDSAAGTRQIYITDKEEENATHCKGILAAQALKSEIEKDERHYVCLFVNNPEGTSFISEESDWSGNWKGSKYGFSSLYEYKEYKTKEEKLLIIEKFKKIQASLF